MWIRVASRRIAGDCGVGEIQLDRKSFGEKVITGYVGLIDFVAFLPKLSRSPETLEFSAGDVGIGASRRGIFLACRLLEIPDSHPHAESISYDIAWN